MDRERRSVTIVLRLVMLLAAAAIAVDVPVAGERLLLRASESRRGASILLRAAAITPPPSAPLDATLVLAGGAAAGQCHLEVPLAAGGWRPIGGEAAKGWIYRAPRGGVERVVVRPGRIAVRAGGGAWPCALGAAQREPVRVELRLGPRRYCAAFDGARLRRPGAHVALLSPPPAACEKTDLTAATLNVLHGSIGAGCQQSAGCRLEERIDLLYNWIRARGCPDVVTLQEVSTAVAALVTERAPSACPFPYEVAYRRLTTIDDSIVLSRYPVAELTATSLHNNFRRVLHAVVDHPLGPVHVFTTHLASGSDGATAPCGAACPAACVAAGASTVRECQAVQVAEIVAAFEPGLSAPALVTGDFNEEPLSFVHERFTGRGWLDVFLAAGNAECSPATGLGCTSGREDQDLTDLESRQHNVDERIDFIFLVPPPPPAHCTVALDSPEDDDGDGTGTRLFAEIPNPFSPECGAAPKPICWPSDHVGVEVDVDCFLQTPPPMVP